MFNEKQIGEFLETSVAGKTSVEQQVSFLENFTIDKIDAQAIKIFAEFMQQKMSTTLEMPGAIDVCGTGGSGLERINTSTIAAFILAELGVKVAKHGNKAASGRFGSFDLLEELAVEIELDPKVLEAKFAASNLAFIYARNFHPSMKYFAEARQRFAKPTIFNILGPLLNPAKVRSQIIGTTFREQMPLIVESCKLMGREKVMVVRGEDGLDEVTLSGKTEVYELNEGRIEHYFLNPADFGVQNAAFSEIAGGDNDFNSNIALEILKGNCLSRHADLVFVNVALALKLSGKVADFKEGYEMARSVCGYKSLAKYRGDILSEIAASKLLVKSDRNFLAAIQKPGISLIAEVKYASPSGGVLISPEIKASEIAKTYEENGASAISVLTDKKYFRGGFEFLKEVRDATVTTPLLCKDFIIQEHQIYKARENGADAILLIAALLSGKEIDRFMQVAQSLGMDALVEVHDERELNKVLKTPAKIIGINNRNLRTFEIDPSITVKLSALIPEDRLIVAESGIKSATDLISLPERINAVLVGTSIMKAPDMALKIKELSNSYA